jgi:hypothetical protein
MSDRTHAIEAADRLRRLANEEEGSIQRARERVEALLNELEAARRDINEARNRRDSYLAARQELLNPLIRSVVGPLGASMGTADGANKEYPPYLGWGAVGE